MGTKFAVGTSIMLTLAACMQSEENTHTGVPLPKETIDLGALITEDLPERVWGKALLNDNDFSEPNSFNVKRWVMELSGGSISGSNSYYTLFNHGGPHVDAPNHIGLAGGIDSYPVEVFSGPAKVFDVSHFPPGRTVDKSFFLEQDIESGDIVLIHTSYTPPVDDSAYPVGITLTREAAEYLAGIPIQAIGTDSFSTYSFQGTRPVETESPLVQAVPIHEAFLSLGIPIYEQLFNVDRLLGKENLFFTGVPLNVKDGDGMVVRPVVFVY